MSDIAVLSYHAAERLYERVNVKLEKMTTIKLTSIGFKKSTLVNRDKNRKDCEYWALPESTLVVVVDGVTRRALTVLDQYTGIVPHVYDKL
jgi:hypothetical protein